LNAWLLWRSLRKQGLFQPQPGWSAYALRIVLACAAMVAVLVLARHYVGPWQPLAARWRLLHLAWAIPAGVATYAAALYACGLRYRHLRERTEPDSRP
jgi:putative peptidoglycan lipid II flippase